jgi:hypothetical protein
MMAQGKQSKLRLESLRLRITKLSSLRDLLSLNTSHGLTERQWSVLERQLGAAESRLLNRLNLAATQGRLVGGHPRNAQQFNELLGEIELALSRAYIFFDTYMDVLTQRSLPELGAMLAGCDALALDALRVNHPALELVEPPVVFCDRGFGASIIRERVSLPDASQNPMPLIQIPYSRLQEKYNLTSVLHEVGHQALVQLGLVKPIREAVETALKQSGASDALSELFGLWSSEIGPDFWAFCLCGSAQALSLRDLLALPKQHTLHVSWSDPHPPPYLRVLISFELNRQMWGAGDWDRWEEDWNALYPLAQVSREARNVLREGKRFIGVVARTLLSARFKALDRRRIPDLFDMDSIHPFKVIARVSASENGSLNLRGLSSGGQLAVFRTLREKSKISDIALDQLMSVWLKHLGARRTLNSVVNSLN